MDPMKTAPQWGPFLSSYMGQAPAMKGVTPSSRTMPADDRSGWDSTNSYRPTSTWIPRSGETSGYLTETCPEGWYTSDDGRCISPYGGDGYRPPSYNSDVDAARVAVAAGCPPGSYFYRGRCLTGAEYAP